MENSEIQWTALLNLKLEEIQKLPDELSGAYRLSFKHDNGSVYVFYVGQSTNIKNQLETFLSKENKNVCILNYISTKECYFKYAEIEEENKRKATERLMYKTYAPMCNESLPDGREDIPLNLS